MIRRRFHALAVGGVVMHFILLPKASRGGQALLDLARSGNQSALQSIRSLSCRLTVTHTPDQGERLHVTEYYKSSEGVCYRWRSGGEYEHGVVRDSTFRGVAKRLQRGGRGQLLATIASNYPGKRLGANYDAWFMALCSFPAPDLDALPFNEVLRKPHELRKATYETANGQRFIVVAYSSDLGSKTHADCEIWFDPRANYLACKCVSNYTRVPGSTPRRKETEVVRFLEAAPAIFFPEHVESRYYTNKKLDYSEVVKFADIRINTPLPADTFQYPPIPAGAIVTDLIQRITYTADGAGKPAGKPLTLKSHPPLSAASGQAVESETTEEPKAMSRWILPASLSLLGVAVGVHLVRRWRTAVKP